MRNEHRMKPKNGVQIDKFANCTIKQAIADWEGKCRRTLNGDTNVHWNELRQFFHADIINFLGAYKYPVAAQRDLLQYIYEIDGAPERLNRGDLQKELKVYQYAVEMLAKLEEITGHAERCECEYSDEDMINAESFVRSFLGGRYANDNKGGCRDDEE